MEASQSLRRPSNWQDFESLCKKLWGEIWMCPEIKKNGRAGQNQNGVDIYGVPFSETGYYGIQCKGKDEYTNKQFDEKEIIEEIAKAKEFLPPLRKLYFATTAVKDAKIEEFIRMKNIEHQSKGLFEIHLFSWEDIVELIDENKATHDWYIKNQKFKSNKSITISFENGSKEIILSPKFKITTTYYRDKAVFDEFQNSSYAKNLITPMQQALKLRNAISPMQFASSLTYSECEINLSYASIRLLIHNTGSETIEDYKLYFNFGAVLQDLQDTNKKNIIGLNTDIFKKSNTLLSSDSMSGKMIPHNPILVGDDIDRSDNIYIKPLSQEYTIPLIWKLIARDFKEEGELTIIVKPKIEIEYKTILVDDPIQARVEKGEIEDVIIRK